MVIENGTTPNQETTIDGKAYRWISVGPGPVSAMNITDGEIIVTTVTDAGVSLWSFVASVPASATSGVSSTQSLPTGIGIPGITESIATATEKGSEAPSTTDSTATQTGKAEQGGNDNGLGGGAVAGIAIACIVAGIALGAVAVFFLFRRRRRQPQTNFNQVSNGDIELKDNVMVAVTPSKSDVDLNQFLLDAIPDKQIEGELHALSELLYQHIESHYHRSPVHLDAQTLAQSLVHIGYSPAASGLDAMTVVALCLEPSSRPVGLRHVLSHVIFSSLDFSSGSNMAMLPPVVRDFLSTIPSAESNGTAPATSLALSKWRSLSTLLLHPTPADRTPLPVSVAEASQQAGSLANELNTFLRFFAPQDAAGSQAQTSHLQDVILECTKLGYILLSQPSDWRFVFSDKQSRRVVVCPGLEKLSHSDGTRYRSPKEVVAVVTMPV
ncbi:hypothetical protein CEP54_005881 [Fusarium duplospermum]|uniref:Uncharacterized protein n=1 Tax=Fusarium duplospermum TaxID=1325734 RepID=A0A428Q9W9_9HYPO|nr:hypothetical protein CEP54_005881 [Fusarium duplospermum]